MKDILLDTTRAIAGVPFKEMPEGDEIYNLSERERGRREGFNEALVIIKKMLIEKSGFVSK